MDLNVSAFRIVKTLTTETKTIKDLSPPAREELIGGPARARKLTPERRKEIATKANKARWKTDNFKHMNDVQLLTPATLTPTPQSIDSDLLPQTILELRPYVGIADKEDVDLFPISV